MAGRENPFRPSAQGPRGAALVCGALLLDQQPRRAWTVDELAQAVALSPPRFAARFSAMVGLSPMAYVAAWRMQHTVRLLADRQLRPSHVASQVGCDSAAAFSRAFRRHIGDSPSTIRQKQRPNWQREASLR